MFFAATPRHMGCAAPPMFASMHALDGVLDQDTADGVPKAPTRREVKADNAVWTLSLDATGVTKAQLNIRDIEGPGVRIENARKRARQSCVTDSNCRRTSTRQTSVAGKRRLLTLTLAKKQPVDTSNRLTIQLSS